MRRLDADALRRYLEGDGAQGLFDYKIFCFNGEPKVMFVASDRTSDNVKFDYFDMQFHHLDIGQKYPHAEAPLRKPKTFEQMIELSKVLSKGFPHVRMDFYEVDGHLYFGEMTFYHFSGFMPFEPAKWDWTFGDWLNLPGRT